MHNKQINRDSIGYTQSQYTETYTGSEPTVPTRLGWRAAARSAAPTVATEHPSHLQEGGGEREVGGGGERGKVVR